VGYNEIKSAAELRAWAFEMAREEGETIDANIDNAEKLLEWIKKPYNSPTFAAGKAA